MNEKKPLGVPENEIPKILVDGKCRKCFGRGWTARHADDSVVPCVCTFKNLKRRHEKAVMEALKTNPPAGAAREKQEAAGAPEPGQQETGDGQEDPCEEGCGEEVCQACRGL